jgi:isopropylmalate/homocitrate/citramalate synthase
VLLDDETLRDGLQSPSVRCPSIDEKLRILHLIDRLGIDTADIGLPGAGPHVVRDVERLAREIADQRLRVAANCAARTLGRISGRSRRSRSAREYPSSAARLLDRVRCGSMRRGGRSISS